MSGPAARGTGRGRPVDTASRRGCQRCACNALPHLGSGPKPTVKAARLPAGLSPCFCGAPRATTSVTEVLLRALFNLCMSGRFRLCGAWCYTDASSRLGVRATKGCIHTCTAWRALPHWSTLARTPASKPATFGTWPRPDKCLTDESGRPAQPNAVPVFLRRPRTPTSVTEMQPHVCWTPLLRDAAGRLRPCGAHALASCGCWDAGRHALWRYLVGQAGQTRRSPVGTGC